MRKQIIFVASAIIYSIMFLLLNSSIVSAVEIGISPAQIEFKADVNQETCKKASVYSGDEENLIGSDKWSNEKTFVKDIRKYMLNANERGRYCLLNVTFK